MNYTKHNIHINHLNCTILTVHILTHVTVTDVQGCQERGDDELLLEHFNCYTETQIAGEQVHTKMTLILDKDTGNTEDL